MTITQQAAPRPAALGTLLLQGEHRIAQLARAHAGWGLSAGTRWELDQANGLMSWTFPDRVATAPAQVIGVYVPYSTSWRWAWADRTILPGLAGDSRTVCDWAEHHGQAQLARPHLQARDEVAATVAALAVRLTSATGFFRGTGNATIPFITFGTVTLTTRSGETTTFTA